MTDDFESAIDAFPVKLEHFDGPLDLLLHLIKRNEVNIYDIPIALITQQYLDAIHLMQEMNLDVAGDYLVLAATLIHIKSRMLLPRPETAAAADGEEEDPRDRLVQRLLEHQKYKAAAGLLHEREQVRHGRTLGTVCPSLRPRDREVGECGLCPWSLARPLLPPERGYSTTSMYGKDCCAGAHRARSDFILRLR